MKRQIADFLNTRTGAIAALTGGVVVLLSVIALLSRQRATSIEIAEAPVTLPVPVSAAKSSIEPAPLEAAKTGYKWWAWGLGIASCLLLARVLYQLQPGLLTGFPPFLLIGVIGLAAAYNLRGSRIMLDNSRVGTQFIVSTQNSETIFNVVRAIFTVVGVAALIALVAINVPITGLPISSHVQLLLLIAGVVFISAGIGGIRPRDLRIERRELTLVLALLAVAFALRIWNVEGALRFFVDELNFSSDALAAWRVGDVPILQRFSSVAAFPWLYPYLQSLGIHAFGRNLVGLRVVSVIFGALTIPAIYLLARALFDRRIALGAALLLATFPPHLHFSRLGLNNIADPLFGTLAVAWLAWGFRTGKRAYFAMGGAALGLTQYFYDGGRLLYLPLVALWLIACWLVYMLERKQPKTIHWSSSNVLIFIITAALITVPIYIAVLAQGASFSQRFDTEAMPARLTGAELAQFSEEIPARVWYTFAFYISVSDQSYFYRGNTPLLLIFMAAPFLMGISYAIWRFRYYGSLLLLLWLAGTAIGNSLITNSLISARYVVVFPALVLLVAVGLNAVLTLFLGQRPLRHYLFTGLIAIFAITQTVFYFGPHLTLYNDQSRVHLDSQDTAFRSVDFPAYTQIHLVTGGDHQYHGYAAGVLGLLRDDLEFYIITPANFSPGYLQSLSPHADHAFYLLPEDSGSLERLRQYFNVTGPYHSPYPLPENREFVLYYAAQEDN